MDREDVEKIIIFIVMVLAVIAVAFNRDNNNDRRYDEAVSEMSRQERDGIDEAIDRSKETNHIKWEY